MTDVTSPPAESVPYAIPVEPLSPEPAGTEEAACCPGVLRVLTQAGHRLLSVAIWALAGAVVASFVPKMAGAQQAIGAAFALAALACLCGLPVVWLGGDERGRAEARRMLVAGAVCMAVALAWVGVSQFRAMP